MTATDLKPIIEKLAGGTFFSAVNVKKDGTIRKYNCRLGVRKGVTGQGLAFDPTERNLIVVWDRKEKQHRMLNVATLIELKVRGKKIVENGKINL